MRANDDRQVRWNVVDHRDGAVEMAKAMAGDVERELLAARRGAGSGFLTIASVLMSTPSRHPPRAPAYRRDVKHAANPREASITHLIELRNKTGDAHAATPGPVREAGEPGRLVQKIPPRVRRPPMIRVGFKTS